MSLQGEILTEFSFFQSNRSINFSKIKRLSLNIPGSIGAAISMRKWVIMSLNPCARLIIKYFSLQSTIRQGGMASASGHKWGASIISKSLNVIMWENRRWFCLKSCSVKSRSFILKCGSGQSYYLRMALLGVIVHNRKTKHYTEWKCITSTKVKDEGQLSHIRQCTTLYLRKLNFLLLYRYRRC